ncbi:MAG: hypothetical protein SFY69_12350 [Planctomycetota bacterium]|nr:hypothetical protein [Planctomycetota bacterium]
MRVRNVVPRVLPNTRPPDHPLGTLGVLIACLLAHTAIAANVFDVGGKAPTQVVITFSAEAPTLDDARSPMLDLLRGVVSELAPDEIRRLRGAGAGAGARAAEVPLDAPPPTWFAHASGDRGGKIIELHHLSDGRLVAREQGAGKGTELDRDKVLDLARTWARFDPRRPPAHPVRPGVAGALAGQHTRALDTMDKRSLGERFLNGRPTSIAGAVRRAPEPFLYRAPATYDPRTPVGVIVWIDARPRAALDESLFDACDRLGFVLIGAAATGNDRPTADRFQLALDALATARARHLVDARRVYVSGLSGGGKISTHLWACFPDEFTGALPIVALASYIDVPAGPGKVWKGDYQLPRDRARLALLRTHRIGVITGGADFNHAPIVGTAIVMERDKLPVRVFDYPDMSHTMPTSERFLEAMTWVDEPNAQAVRAEQQAARERWAALPGPQEPARRGGLVEITRRAPWTPESWKAAEELGIALPPPVAPAR